MAVSERERESIQRRRQAHEAAQVARQAAAEAAWRRLSRTRQFELVRQIVETRGEELRRSQPGVHTVLAGFGTRSVGDSDERARRDPCVTFVVTRKRPKGAKPSSRRPDVPTTVLAYANVDGRPVLCAVPTDVEDVAATRAKLQYNVAIACPCGRDTITCGVATCIVRRGGSDARWMISCRHVLGGTDVGLEQFPVGTKVALMASTRPRITYMQPEFAVASDFYGAMELDEPVSFDAALAEVATLDPGILRGIVRPFTEDGFAESIEEIRRIDTYHLWAPGGPKLLEFIGPIEPGDRRARFNYGKRAGKTMWICPGTTIVRSKTVGWRTERGISGSPIVSRSGRFLGMHFAGNGLYSFMIPAFDLLASGNYAGLADGETFQLVTDY